MSAQAGIFYFDGRPIEPTVPAALLAQLEEFGPDGSGQHVAPGLVMVHRALHVTPEDCLERQPYISERGHVMTWDGRLDNRDDLLLQLRRDLRDDTTDVAIAMAAYERWGFEAFARLVGDWSLAIFDATQRSVVLASDYMGVRPMYYLHTDESLVWSSSLEAVVRYGRRESEIDPYFVFGQLIGLPEPDLTPYPGVLSLSPGHVLIRNHVTHTLRQFARRGLTWLEYQRHEDYAEHLREVLKQAVGARLRAKGPVWCEVSGGLDSSSIACMAHRIASGRRPGALRFVSYVNDSSLESDERRFAKDVERQCGVETRYLRYDHHPRLGAGRWLMPVVRSPIFGEVARLMHADGARVILTGRVGDGVMGNFPADYGNLSTLLRTGQLARFVAEARAWSLASQDPIINVVSRSVTWFLPRSVRIQSADSAFMRTQAGHGDTLDPVRLFSLDERFANAHRPGSMIAVDRALHAAVPRNPAVLKVVCEYAILRRLQSPWWTPQVVWSHPYADRRVVDFVTAIPFSVLCPAGRPRALMKSALAGVLPKRIHDRFSKGYAVPYTARALRPVAERLLARVDQLAVVRRGYIDPIMLSDRLRALLSGSATRLGNLLNIGAVEAWLEAHEREIGGAEAPSAMHASTSPVDGITLRPDAVA